MPDKRNDIPEKGLSEELVKKGKDQLQAEIAIIEGWLEDLKETRDDNSAAQASRKSYGDMLRSRQELLNTLKVI